MGAPCWASGCSWLTSAADGGMLDLVSVTWAPDFSTGSVFERVRRATAMKMHGLCPFCRWYSSPIEKPALLSPCSSVYTYIHAELLHPPDPRMALRRLVFTVKAECVVRV